MSVFLKLYDPNDTYMTPAGELADSGFVSRTWPASSRFAHVVQTDETGETMFGFYNLSAMRTQYGIAKSLSAEEAVAELSAAMEAEQVAQVGDQTESTPEERIAAALELANVINLPDINSDDPDAE